LPADYVFVPRGDVYITRNCRSKTKESQRLVYKVYVRMLSLSLDLLVNLSSQTMAKRSIGQHWKEVTGNSCPGRCLYHSLTIRTRNRRVSSWRRQTPRPEGPSSVTGASLQAIPFDASRVSRRYPPSRFPQRLRPRRKDHDHFRRAQSHSSGRSAHSPYAYAIRDASPSGKVAGRRPQRGLGNGSSYPNGLGWPGPRSTTSTPACT
jgi:hypothetical protein